MKNTVILNTMAGYIIIDIERFRVPMQKITDYTLVEIGLKTPATIHPLQKIR